VCRRQSQTGKQESIDLDSRPPRLTQSESGISVESISCYD
jgi:hypothetical protein